MGLCVSAKQNPHKKTTSLEEPPVYHQQIKQSAINIENIPLADDQMIYKQHLQTMQFHPLHPENSLVDLGLKSFNSMSSKKPSLQTDDNKMPSIKALDSPTNENSNRSNPIVEKGKHKASQNEGHQAENTKKEGFMRRNNNQV